MMIRKTITIVLAGLLCTCSMNIKTEVPLYRVFETNMTNNTAYENKIRDVSIDAVFTSPSGKEIKFWGFYDGDGMGGQEGNVWKLRFMPDEIGVWKYTWTWSDDTEGGAGTFTCIKKNAGPGILKPYVKNPRWVAYNGKTPVMLRSYYVGKMTHTPLDWSIKHVYQPLIDKGYNHIQYLGTLNRWMDHHWLDSPEHLTEEPGYAWHMNMASWQRTEEHLLWLNEKDIMVHHWTGIGRGEVYAWDDEYKKKKLIHKGMTDEEKEIHVKYIMSRLAPLANQAGWGYRFERQAPDDFMGLLAKYDPWNHLRGGQNFHEKHPYEQPKYTWLSKSEYYHQEKHWPHPPHTPQSYHETTALAYSQIKPDMPLVMNEGDLWHGEYLTSEENMRRLAWAATTAGALFTWNWASTELWECCKEWKYPHRMFESNADEYLEILYTTMEQEVPLGLMEPNDALILSTSTPPTFAMSGPDNTVLVFDQDGGTITLKTVPGPCKAVWIDTKTGEKLENEINIMEKNTKFESPDTNTDWVLILKKIMNID